jgi:4-hydroxybenzoate polyprenyltransferase
VTFFIVLGILVGVLYSAPPFRLRMKIVKPIVNFSVGAVPVLIVAAFFNTFSIEVWSLMLLIGITTAVNSLWEDLADYGSDFYTNAKTMVVILGFKRGLYVTIIMGYWLVPPMVLVGVLFDLSLIYYLVLAALVVFISLRLIQKRALLFGVQGDDTDLMLELGELFAKDFSITAIIHTANLMLNGFLMRIF